MNDAIEHQFCHSAWLKQIINSFTTQMIVNSDNNIDKKDSYQQSSNSSDSKNENENTMNESNREVSLNTRSIKNCSQSVTWCIEFYSFSFLQNMNFMTLKSQCHSSFWQQDFLYCQFYNMSKKIFIAKNHELFANMNLNKLTLNLNLLCTWQHIEKKLSQSSLILLKAYIHMKQWCYFVLTDCCNQFYEMQEKYCISESVLKEMNWIFYKSNIMNKCLLISLNLTFFFSHCTTDVLNWVWWNVNKLCLSFELIFSLQLQTMIHWEHSCVMIMFLQYLLCDYESQSNHI